MSFETKTDDMGLRVIGSPVNSFQDSARVNTPTEGAFTVSPTQRTDANDAAANDTQAFTNVAAEIDPATSIGTITNPGCTAGVFSWAITAGNGAGDFSISNQGTLHRVAAHTLVGPYELTIRFTEGSPLFRFRDVTVTVTVA